MTIAHSTLTGAELHDPKAHASGHLTGGGDEVDGDKLDIDFTPSNYTPDTTPAEADSVDNLTAHLYGIDQALSGGGGSAYYPQRASLFAINMTQVSGSSWTATVDSSQAFCNFLDSAGSAVIGDKLSASFMLKAGTYNIRILGVQSTVAGIHKVTIDAVDVWTGIDWYGALTRNTSKSTSGVTVTGDGRHILDIETTGKNASSSAYRLLLTSILIWASTETEEN